MAKKTARLSKEERDLQRAADQKERAIREFKAKIEAERKRVEFRHDSYELCLQHNERYAVLEGLTRCLRLHNEIKAHMDDLRIHTERVLAQMANAGGVWIENSLGIIQSRGVEIDRRCGELTVARELTLGTARVLELYVPELLQGYELERRAERDAITIVEDADNAEWHVVKNGESIANYQTELGAWGHFASLVNYSV